jgi:hypothetical protein
MLKNKKALLVGSSFSAAPIYFELKKRNLHVTVCGNSQNDPCHQYADASIYVDYADRQALQNVVDENYFDYIVPTCNDYSYLSSCWVAERLGFPGFDTVETTEILHTKQCFRARTSTFNLPAPRLIDEMSWREEKVPFPYLVKPVDSFSGRGVTKVADPEQMTKAIEDAREASRSNNIIIEEFVDGTLHSHSAFISGQRIMIDFFVDEFCTTYPYQVNCSNHPSRLVDDIRQDIRAAIESLARELNIVDGLLHTQFISNGRKFWIIECMRRGPGDLYGSLIERSTGIDYTSLYILPFVNEPYPEKLKPQRELFYGRHTISSRQSLVNFSFAQQIPAEEVEIMQLKNCGEKMEAAPFDKLAIILARFSDEKTMLASTPNLAEFIHINSLGET